VTDFIETLEQDLVDAARRRFSPARASRRRLRSALLGLAVLAGIGGSAAVATAVVLRSTVIEPPAAVDAGPEQTIVPGSAVVSALRAADPGTEPPWTIRVARGATGLVCTTVGEVQNGTFGLLGTDGRFRTLAPGVVDACGVTQSGKASLMGARVLAASGDGGIRTVLNGVAGPDLRAVTATVAGKRAVLPVGAGGTFVAAYRGYPEDLGIVVELRFADGHVERRSYGAGEGLVADPLGGPAWKVGGVGTKDGYRQSCVAFQPARDGTGIHARSPQACGILPPLTVAHSERTGLFFAVRRLTGTDHPTAGGGDWSRDLPRTALWGVAGKDVRSVTLLGAPGGPRAVPITRGSTILAVLPPTVDPADLRVDVRFADGRAATYRGDTNLAPTPND
jgi:hypothetical protein